MSSIRVPAAIAVLVLLSAAPAAAQSPQPSVRMLPVTSPGFRMRLSPDGTTAAVFSDHDLLNDEVRLEYLPVSLIDVASGATIGRFSHAPDFTADVAFTHDGTRFATFHTNGELDIWDVADPGTRPLRTIQTTFIGGGRVAFLPDDRTLITLVGGFPARFALWDTGTGSIAGLMGQTFPTWAGFKQDYQGFPGISDIAYAAYAVSPDGATLVTATQSDEVATWAIPDGQPVTLRPRSSDPAMFNIRQLEFSADGASLIYYDTSDASTHIWAVASRHETASLPIGGSLFALSRDGSRVAWATRAEGATQVLLAALTPDATPVLVATIPLALAPVSTVAFTRDDEAVVVGGFFADPDANGIAVISVP